MVSPEVVAALELRIREEEMKRDAWRISGPQEKYLEACSMVDALERQLESQLREP